FSCMTSYLRKPDLIVYLRASTWTLITRIRRRGREFERGITPEYLHELNLAYERWIRNASKEMPILTVEADEFEFEQDASRREELFAQIRALCPEE
ncbi:MAG: deoxynucleoside kinase, partial [Candidatus Oleimicrobiaceae bacterium]